MLRFGLLVLLAAVTLGAGCRPRVDSGAASAERPLIWAADTEGGAPYVFADPENPKQVIGFEKDIADALAKELGRPIEFKQYEFNTIIAGVGRNDFDFAMNGIEITPDRKTQVRFSKPYYVYKLQLVTRDNDDRFQSLKDLERKKDVTVGTLEDTAASRLLDKLGIKKEIYPGQVEPYQKLAEGRLDAVLLDLPIALYYAQKEPKLKHAHKAPKLKFVGEPMAPGYYALAFNLKNEALAKQVDEALDRLHKSGALKKIYEKWGLWNDDQKELQ